MDSICYGHDLFGRAMFEAALDQEVAKAIDHERICLVDNRFHYFELLLSRADFQLLLQEDGGLLIVAAHNFVHDVLPVARHRFVKKTTIVHGLERCNIRLTAGTTHLGLSAHLLPSRHDPNENMRLTDDHGLPKAGKDPLVKLDIVGDNGEPTGPG